jgi:hypothetical protein
MLPITVELSYIASDTVNRAIPHLENLFKTLAKASGWPEYIINAISIQYDGENIVLIVPPEVEEEVDNLEYGSLNNIPNAVIRPFLERSGRVIEPIFANNTIDDLLELEEVF